jgi:hypothetical protein
LKTGRIFFAIFERHQKTLPSSLSELVGTEWIPQDVRLYDDIPNDLDWNPENLTWESHVRNFSSSTSFRPGEPPNGQELQRVADLYNQSSEVDEFMGPDIIFCYVK